MRGDAALAALLERPLSRPEPAVLAALAASPIDPGAALDRGDLDRLLDSKPLPCETGWCRLGDGTLYVAVRTPMPGVGAEMVDWWFDWHPRAPLRYRVWHPKAHLDNRLEPARGSPAKPFWGAVHHPVEDIGTGPQRIRIEFQRPSEIGFATDALDLAGVATVVAGLAGDEARRVRHTLMVHVFLGGDDGLALRSHFWIGAVIRPYAPSPLAAPLARLLNVSAVRRRMIADAVAPALAHHCAEEYANLAQLLPQLYAEHGPGAGP